MARKAENNGKKQDKSGPKPENLQIEGDWKEAIERAIHKKKPAKGWPDEKKKHKK